MKHLVDAAQLSVVAHCTMAPAEYKAVILYQHFSESGSLVARSEKSRIENQ